MESLLKKFAKFIASHLEKNTIPVEIENVTWQDYAIAASPIVKKGQ